MNFKTNSRTEASTGSLGTQASGRLNIPFIPDANQSGPQSTGPATEEAQGSENPVQPWQRPSATSGSGSSSLSEVDVSPLVQAYNNFTASWERAFGAPRRTADTNKTSSVTAMSSVTAVEAGARQGTKQVKQSTKEAGGKRLVKAALKKADLIAQGHEQRRANAEAMKAAKKRVQDGGQPRNEDERVAMLWDSYLGVHPKKDRKEFRRLKREINASRKKNPDLPVFKRIDLNERLRILWKLRHDDYKGDLIMQRHVDDEIALVREEAPDLPMFDKIDRKYIELIPDDKSNVKPGNKAQRSEVNLREAPRSTVKLLQTLEKNRRKKAGSR